MSDAGSDVCVLGGGVSGLTTAISLRLLGYRVRVAAEDLIGTAAHRSRPHRPDPNFASLYPAASIIPHLVAVTDVPWHVETSLRFYAALQFAATAGVRRQPHFELFERPVDTPEYARYLTGFEPLSAGPGETNGMPIRPGSQKVWGWKFECLFAEMPEYSHWLRQTFHALGGSVLRCGRLDYADLGAIPEGVIVNCTGYGSAALFGDATSLSLTKGVLVKVYGGSAAFDISTPTFSYNYTPDPGIYATSAGRAADVYWYPRVDGWVLGGTRLAGRINRSGHWTGEEPVGPTIDIDGVAVPRPIIDLNRDLIKSATGRDITGWPRTATVGYRCTRRAESGGVRLESEGIGNKLIVHNYGHGGAGVALAWSSAVRVAQIIAGAGHRGRAPSPSPSPSPQDQTLLGLLAGLAKSAVRSAAGSLAPTAGPERSRGNAVDR